MSDKEDKKSPLRVKGEQKPVKKQSNTSYAIKIILLLVLLGINIFLINKVVNRSKVKEEIWKGKSGPYHYIWYNGYKIEYRGCGTCSERTPK